MDTTLQEVRDALASLSPSMREDVCREFYEATNRTVMLTLTGDVAVYSGDHRCLVGVADAPRGGLVSADDALRIAYQARNSAQDAARCAANDARNREKRAQREVERLRAALPAPTERRGLARLACST